MIPPVLRVICTARTQSGSVRSFHQISDFQTSVPPTARPQTQKVSKKELLVKLGEHIQRLKTNYERGCSRRSCGDPGWPGSVLRNTSHFQNPIMSPCGQNPGICLLLFSQPTFALETCPMRPQIRVPGSGFISYVEPGSQKRFRSEASTTSAGR